MLVPAGRAGTSPHLDYVPQEADLIVAQAGGRITALALAGGYRPQPGPAGTGLDQAIVRQCATATIHSFLDRVACVLAHPAGTAETRRS